MLSENQSYSVQSFKKLITEDYPFSIRTGLVLCIYTPKKSGGSCNHFKIVGYKKASDEVVLYDLHHLNNLETPAQTIVDLLNDNKVDLYFTKQLIQRHLTIDDVSRDYVVSSKLESL